MKTHRKPPSSIAGQSVSRRDFIATTGLGIAALSGTGVSIARGAPSRDKIRLGLIGCGGRGQWLLNLFTQHGGYQIASVADFFKDRTDEAGEKFGVSKTRRFIGEYCAEEMIAAGGLDAVAIISPPYFHPGQAASAVQVGLHVYLAKPVAVDVAGCRSIQRSGEAARAKGRVFLVDFQTRTNEYYIEAIRRLQSGDYGKIAFGEAKYHAGRLRTKADPGTPGARLRNWVFDIALSGDIIVEQNIHSLDVMSWVMGDKPPLRCSGTGGRQVRTDVGDCWDNFQLTYEYPGDVGVTFSSRQFDAFGEPGGITNRFFATGGVFSSQYGGNVYLRSDGDRFYRGGDTGSIYKDGAVSNIASFHRAVTEGDHANPTLEPSVMSNMVSIMGRMAAYSGKTVTWEDVQKSSELHQVDLSGFDPLSPAVLST